MLKLEIMHGFRDCNDRIYPMKTAENTDFGPRGGLVGSSYRKEWWARQDSNLQPDGYEPSALTS